ncbi:MAG: oligosaccharide flippase family protein, partial [Muribaculaceae bacterium]|nr:oligosaccharide flippase family protein [Muribaculaceae bacterium]
TLLTINLDFKTTTKISLIAGVLSGFIGVALAYYGFGVWALVWQAISAAAITTLLTFLMVKWLPRSGFCKDSFKRLFSFSSRLFAANLISAVYDKIFGAIIGKMFSKASLGFYDRALSFNVLLNNNVTHVLGRVSYPLLSQIQDDNERLMNIYKRYIAISAFLTFPLMMLLCGIAKPMILGLLTAKWANSIILLQVLTFGFLWDGVIVSNLNLIKVKGRSDLVLRLEIIKKVIAFALCGGALIVFRSVLALCVAKAVYGFIALILNTIYTKRIINYGFLRQLSDYWPYLAASAGVLVISLGCSALIANNWIALGSAILRSGGFYLGVCHLFKLYAYQEILGLLR